MNDFSYTFTVDGRPKSKDRPRHGRGGHTYTPKETTDAERRIAAAYGGPTFDGPVCVEVDYYFDRQVISVRPVGWRSNLLADVDNLVKLTFDGLQRAGAFGNDRQVMQVNAVKHPRPSE